jgi:hypothetical protein
MSKFRNLIESTLLEMISLRIPMGDFIDFTDEKVTLYKNPNLHELQAITDKLPAHSNKTLRGLILNDQFYVWDAYEDTHICVVSQLLEMPVDEITNEGYGFYIKDNKLCVDELAREHYPKEIDRTLKAIANNYNTSRVFSQENIDNPVIIDADDL